MRNTSTRFFFQMTKERYPFVSLSAIREENQMSRMITSFTTSMILLFGAIFFVVSFSDAQTIHNLKNRQIDDVNCLTVYFMPLRLATFAPVNEERIKHDGRKITICDPNDFGLLRDMIRSSSVLTIQHKGQAPEIDHNNIRIRVESERGEHLVFVDTNGVVNNAGRQYQLTPDAKHNLELCETSWQNVLASRGKGKS